MRQDQRPKTKDQRREGKILVAGSGGQGIMLLGRIIAEAAVRENKNVTYIRSYGAEMRGGTAHCFVKVSKKEIASPVFEKANVSIIMNQLSLGKFKNRLDKNSMVIANASLTESRLKIQNVRAYYYPFNDMANSLGDVRVANMVALGAFLKKAALVNKQSAITVLKERFGSQPRVLEMNLNALELGWKEN